jgi:hypothetical protein
MATTAWDSRAQPALSTAESAVEQLWMLSVRQCGIDFLGRDPPNRKVLQIVEKAAWQLSPRRTRL